MGNKGQSLIFTPAWLQAYMWVSEHKTWLFPLPLAQEKRYDPVPIPCHSFIYSFFFFLRLAHFRLY